MHPANHSPHVQHPGPRFNLLREETEGYAKLATLLNQQASGRLTDASTSAVVRGSKSCRLHC